jgi:hypothetical protein
MKICTREHLFSTILVCLLMVTVGINGSSAYGTTNQVYSAELSAPEKALAFLTNVVKLDMTKYNATLVGNWVDFPPHWGGIAQEVVRYDLDRAGESKLYVTCRLRDKILYSCGLEVLKGSPIYTEPQPTNVLDMAKALLERYQTYSGASYIQTMRNMLDTIDEIKNMTTTLDNAKLIILIEDVPTASSAEPIIHTNFEWIYTVNGIDAPQNVVSFALDQEVFRSFRDDWNLYKIGSTDVNVSKEEAIDMAMNAAENYTLKIWMNEWIEVEFTIVDEPVTAELFMYPRETLTVYPFWRIELYFDKLYYSAYGIQVGIWADTKQIKYCESLSYAGGPPEKGNPTTPTNESFPTTWIVTAIAIVAVVGATLLVYFKKVKKTTGEEKMTEGAM